MVLAIGKEQTAELQHRYKQFKFLSPKLELINREEIQLLEPNVVKNRELKEDILALSTEEGYTINFQKLAQSFLNKSIEHSPKSINLMMKTKVNKLEKEGELYHIQTTKGVVAAKVVVFTTGAYSLLFAKSLGYGKDYALLDVAGSFYLHQAFLMAKSIQYNLRRYLLPLFMEIQKFMTQARLDLVLLPKLLSY